MQNLYVNIYSVGQSYGGPEEGGWWFPTGTPIGAIPVELTEDEWQAARENAVEAGVLTEDFSIVPLDTENHVHSDWCSPTERDIHYLGEDIPKFSARCHENAWRSFMDDSLHAKAKEVQDMWRERYSPTGNQYSVLGGEDYEVRIEKAWPQPFPKERPRYE